MNISKTIFAASMAAMLVLPSCKDDDTDPVEYTEPVVDPSGYKEQNVKAIQKAQIAAKTPLFETENYYDVMQFTWTDPFKTFASKVSKFSNAAAVAIGTNDDGSNTAVSPISVFMALAMAAESAADDTRQEILDAMGITYDELKANIKHLCYVCNRIRPYESENNRYNEIKCVNSLWVQDGVNVKESGTQSLADLFHTDLFRMDFSGSDVNEIITSYIANETRGFLSPNLQLTPETLLVLMNVVYLRDVWDEYGYALDLTDQKYDFVNYDKSKKSTQLLQGNHFGGRAVETAKFRKFVTDTKEEIALTFFVPKDGYTLDDIYTTEVLNDPTQYIYSEKHGDTTYRFHTRCLFPEYNAGFDGYIQDVIKQMGVNKFFSLDCNFSNLTDDLVYCSKIRHIAKLEVTCFGIEGAAVTAEMMEGAAGPGMEIYKDIYEDFVVDRNFAYVISKDNIPIFTGVVKSIE